jgi:N-acetylglucosaminyl-diphospho-decaprenol L-rhamnosyltransferase
MLIRDELWLELGGFDERIFMYSEELDLFWRARRLGWRLWFTPAAEFVHIGNASSGRHWESAERAEMVSRSESAMIRRHQSPLAARLTLFFMAAGLAARRAVYRIGRKREAVASLNGHLRGISRR